jgi:hypothetical protein
MQGKEAADLVPWDFSVALVYKSEITNHLFKAIDAVRNEQTYRSPFYLK